MYPYVIAALKRDEDLFPFIQYLRECGKRKEAAIVFLASSPSTNKEEREKINLIVDANISSALITISLVTRLEDGIGADIFLKGTKRFTSGTVYHNGKKVSRKQITGSWKDAFTLFRGYARADTSKPFSLVGEITADTSINLLNYLLACSSRHVPAIITIWSGGGDCTFLFPLKVAAEMLPKITTVGIKKVGSTAFSIFLFGTERFLCPGTECLVHHPKYEGNGGLLAGKMEIVAKELKGIWSTMQKIILAKTNIDFDVLTENTADGRDWKIGSDDWARFGITTGDYKEARNLV